MSAAHEELHDGQPQGQPSHQQLSNPPSPALSDKDADTFEDAVDSGSVRSLTNRTLSQSKSPPPMTRDSHMSLDSPAASEAPRRDSIDSTDAPIELVDKPLEGSNADDMSGDRSENGTVTNSARNSKLSNVSLDNVDLNDDSLSKSKGLPTSEVTADSTIPTEPDSDFKATDVPEPKLDPPATIVTGTTSVPASDPVPAPAVEDKPNPTEAEPTKKMSLSNITSSLPTMPWSPSADSPPKTSPSLDATATAAPSRKFTSPFAWMSRNSTSKDNIKAQSGNGATSPRRNTASSVTTLTSNPEMMLSRLDEEGDGRGPNGERRPSRNSLRDRFKMVRMREEAGITMPVDDTDTSVPAPVRDRSSTRLSSRETSLDPNGSSHPPVSPNPTLAPGTASGVSAGPSAIPDAQVDWDLWQSVVYEGPAAVARTSAEELNRAIATGIPNVIRGVVWQVLAQSKNENLEEVYRELSVRGSEKEKSKDRNSNGTSVSSSSNGNLSVHDKEQVVSSASSVHSDQSSGSGTKSPPAEPSEATLKAQAKTEAEKKKKEKEEAAALQKLEKTIRRDLGARTSFSKHAVAAGLQDALFGVCKAYALYDEGVGYAQGMNFLIMPLLFNVPEEEAFCLLVRLMSHYKLRDLFIQDMPGLHMHLYQFERMLEDLEPALYCHLHRRGISPHLYATQWFLTLFAYRFPLQLVLRIYDLILSEGLSAILKFGIVLMQKNAATLLGMSDMAQLTTFLKDKIFDVYIDQAPSAGSILENGFFGSSSSSVDKEVYRADQFVRDACDVRVTPELLKAYSVEWEEKTRTEKEREQELEELRTSNMSFAIKVRKLEERLQVSDLESAEMATDLVQTKVQNEELKDKNESLHGQVKELRNVIEKQPEEIESAWKLERDDLMKRNGKVHEENEKLEKDMAELEEELVRTKMKHAEINDQHEALQRKWSELKRQFG